MHRDIDDGNGCDESTNNENIDFITINNTMKYGNLELVLGNAIND